MHNVIRRSSSIISSSVADPSTVTVRIESASISDLNVQDVITSSPSEDDEDFESKQQRQQNTNDRFIYRISSGATSRCTPSFRTNNNNSSFQPRQKRPSRLNRDLKSLSLSSQSRPITAVSLPAKPSAYDNEWNLDSSDTLVLSAQRRNPSCPSISPTNNRSKTSSKSALTHQQVPNIFTTTSECLGRDLHSQTHRDIPRRAQSLVKAATIDNDSSPGTSSIVFLTDEILLGAIRALQNERQLCKLSIDYLIDATNMRPDEVARKANFGARLQCHCGQTHSRCTLTLEFDQPFTPATSTTSAIAYNNLNNSKIREMNRTQLDQLFSAVNRFINKAQQENKRILIYGFELTPTSPLAVIAIQYLILNDAHLTLIEATNRIQHLFPVKLIQNQRYPMMEKRFQDYLKQLDRNKFSRNFSLNGVVSDCSSSGNEYSQSLRDLSSNSSETATANSTPVTSWTTIPTSSYNNNDNNNNDINSSQHMFTTRSAWDC